LKRFEEIQRETFSKVSLWPFPLFSFSFPLPPSFVFSVFVAKKSQGQGQKGHSLAFNLEYRKSGEKNIGLNKRFLFRGVCRMLATNLIYIKQATLLLYANPASPNRRKHVSWPVGKASKRDGAAGG
jgi:hypothetical protein